MEIKNHFGVYCVCFENGKLLCIEKTRGPYHMIYLEAVSNLVKD
ncbi:NTP pyrophosphohydrolase including oxidative damage repair enzymes [Streptococcus pneumoniae]|nr:NTP pyrophosphohydrolase including oxidative damage repair enzymes [Streptococcus pneumoniae]